MTCYHEDLETQPPNIPPLSPSDREVIVEAEINLLAARYERNGYIVESDLERLVAFACQRDTFAPEKGPLFGNSVGAA